MEKGLLIGLDRVVYQGGGNPWCSGDDCLGQGGRIAASVCDQYQFEAQGLDCGQAGRNGSSG
jgi:hypothetical protein